MKTTQKRAFDTFTAEFDSWWPPSHHIGQSPMKRVVIEGRVGGRCYSEQADGTDCAWGEITVWEPPKRFVMAWKINLGWHYEPDIFKSSEVEVRFTPEPDGSTHLEKTGSTFTYGMFYRGFGLSISAHLFYCTHLAWYSAI